MKRVNIESGTAYQFFIASFETPVRCSLSGVPGDEVGFGYYCYGVSLGQMPVLETLRRYLLTHFQTCLNLSIDLFLFFPLIEFVIFVALANYAHN